MAWRQASDRARRAGERRLRDLARQWTPPGAPGAPEAAHWNEPIGESGPETGHRFGGWSPAAVRGLALLGAIVLVITAYGLWMGRPRAVAQPPLVVSTGAPLTGGAAPVPSRQPAPVPDAAPMPTPSSSPSPTAPPVVVHVVGLVRHPGIVRLPAGSRVMDAVTAAGGVTRRRASESVNLARILVDGEQVVLRDHGPPDVGAAAAGAPGIGSPGIGSPGTPTVAIVDLNRATIADLDALPGIGPVIASRIVAWRDANGAFRSVDELGEVSGIGDAILSQVRALVRV